MWEAPGAQAQTPAKTMSPPTLILGDHVEVSEHGSAPLGTPAWILLGDTAPMALPSSPKWQGGCASLSPLDLALDNLPISILDRNVKRGF